MLSKPLSIGHLQVAKNTVLVFAATGKQGGTVTPHLFRQRPSQPFDMIAVSEWKASQNAQSLAFKSNVSVLKGSLDDTSAILPQLPSARGIFSVHVNSIMEEKQGKPIVDGAVAKGVQHVVYASDAWGVRQERQRRDTNQEFRSQV